MEVTTEVLVRPAHHRCHPDEKQDYGICNPTMFFVLRKGMDAIVLTVMPEWGMSDEEFHAACPECVHPRHKDGWPWRNVEQVGSTLLTPDRMTCPTVSWHFTEPRRSTSEAGPCEYVPSGTCYADNGYMVGQAVFDTLRHRGTDGLWHHLEFLLGTYDEPVEVEDMSFGQVMDAAQHVVIAGAETATGDADGC